MKQNYNFQTLGDAPVSGEKQQGQDTEVKSSRCPHCHCLTSRVIETRCISPNGLPLIIRVRKCRHCHKTFRTKEIVDQNIKMPAADSRRKHLDVGAVFPSVD